MFFFCFTVNKELNSVIFPLTHRVIPGTGEIVLWIPRAQIRQGEILRALLQSLASPDIKNVSICLALGSGNNNVEKRKTPKIFQE